MEHSLSQEHYPEDVNPVFAYTVARITLFVLAMLIFYALGAGPLVTLVGAAVVSMLVSYILLSGMRDQVAERVQRRVEGRLERKAGQAERDSGEPTSGQGKPETE